MTALYCSLYHLDAELRLGTSALVALIYKTGIAAQLTKSCKLRQNGYLLPLYLILALASHKELYPLQMSPVQLSLFIGHPGNNVFLQLVRKLF